MPTKSELEKIVDDTLTIEWSERAGLVVPSTETVSLKNGAVSIEAAFLYADLAGTSNLTRLCPWQTTSKIIRSYLDCSVRIIRSYSGEIRSFDGDRVMGVFIGDAKNTNAAKAAREIFYTVDQIIAPKAERRFDSIRNNGIKLKNCIGIDYGTARAVRAGIRNNNDLIWIGKAPSFAAKLSDVRKYPFCVYVSERSYKVMDKANDIVNGESIWKEENFTFAGGSEKVYATRFMLPP